MAITTVVKQVKEARSLILERIQTGTTIYFIKKRVTRKTQKLYIDALVSFDGKVHNVSCSIAFALGLGYRQDAGLIFDSYTDAPYTVQNKLAKLFNIEVQIQWL